MNKKSKTIIFLVSLIVLTVGVVTSMVVENYVNFFSIVQLALLLIMFFSYFTWSQSGTDEKLVPNDELGKKVTMESSLTSYKILTILIFLFICFDKLKNGEPNIDLIIIFALALVILPVIEFFKAKSYN